MGLLADGLVDLEPEEVAFAVVVDVATPVIEGAAGVVEDLRGGGGVLEIAPGAAGASVVEVGGDGGEAVAEDLGAPDAGAGGEDVAEVVGEALIDPEEVALHGLLVVGRGEAGGAAILAVPGVGELVGEEVAFFGEGAFVDEGLLGDAVVGGLVVLEAEVGYLVGERDEEVVGVVVARLVEGSGLADELGELVDVLLGESDVLGTVAGEVEVVLGGDVGGEVDLAEPAAGEDGGVDELLEGDGLEGGGGGGFRGAVDGIERGAEVPAFGNRDAGGDQDVGDVGVRDVPAGPLRG